jgi:hypothetical protein
VFVRFAPLKFVLPLSQVIENRQLGSVTANSKGTNRDTQSVRTAKKRTNSNRRPRSSGLHTMQSVL